MAQKVIDVTGMDFEEVIGVRGLTLFDLWSPRCAPCLALGPILADLAADFEGEVRICKADVTVSPSLTEGFDARSLPTLVLYFDGGEVDRIIGLRSRAELSSWLESHL